MYGLHIIRDIGYWRLNVHFKILLLDLGTSLTEYQKKISTTAETFLNKIILHSGGNIMTEKGQLGNKTVEILEVLPPTQERHWETSVWSWINLCGVLGTYLSLKSWFLRTKFQRFKPGQCWGVSDLTWCCSLEIQVPEIRYDDCFSCTLNVAKPRKIQRVPSRAELVWSWFSDLLYLKGSRRKYIFFKNYIFDTF